MSRYLTLRSAKWPVSLLLDRRALLLMLLLAVGTFAAVVVSIGVGTMFIHPLDVIKALFGAGTDQHALVINMFRLPRILVALLVGIGLAVSGAILQSVIRNPLASPDVIGITGGASAAAVLFIVFFEQVSIHWLPLAAMIGAAVITALIYVLAYKNGITPLRLVLVGVGIGAAMQGLTTMLVVIAPIHLTSKAVIWMTGSVYGSNWQNVLTLLPWIVVFVPLALLFARSINAQQLGEEVATGVGNPVQRHRLILLFICVALAGAAVAIGGAIGFVGLLAPHIARKLVGPVPEVLLPVSALVGGLTVVLADLIARTAFAPLEVPVGIFTAAIGAPFFIYLLYRSRNQ